MYLSSIPNIIFTTCITCITRSEFVTLLTVIHLGVLNLKKHVCKCHSCF